MKPRHVVAALLATVLLSPAALAHPGHHDPDFTWTLSSGMLHPLLGFDHMMAMLAIGIWAVFLGGRLRWQVPSAFAATLLIGSLGGHLLAQASFVIEHGLAASVIALGLLLTFAGRVPAWSGVLLAGVFGLVHGVAHGAELPPAQSHLGYTLGFVVGSVALQIAGAALAFAVTGQPNLRRFAGLTVACAGVLSIT